MKDVCVGGVGGVVRCKHCKREKLNITKPEHGVPAGEARGERKRAGLLQELR